MAADWDLQEHLVLLALQVRWDCREYRVHRVLMVMPVSQALQDQPVRSDCRDHRDYLVSPAPRAIRANRDQPVLLGCKA